jgi:hypothetical protein
MTRAKHSALTTIILALALVGSACSKGALPVVPDSHQPVTSVSPSPDSSGRILMGAFRVEIDESGTITVEPLRAADAHFNVTKALMPPKCGNCFVVQLLWKQGTTYALNVAFRNPTALTGYDVRGIVLDTGDISLITIPDSYTEMFAKPNDPTPRNPFFIFDSGQGQNMWPPDIMAGRDIMITRPDTAKFAEIIFVVDACWPMNAQEPTRIRDLMLSNGLLYTDGSAYTNLTCQVSDWQDDITGVTVDLSPLGGGPAVKLGQAVDGTWFLNGIICSTSCEPGQKTLWVTATSGSQSVYNYATCTVENPPPPEPAEWTFMCYLHAADLPDEEDINEMEMAGSLPGKLNIIVLWDKPEESEQDVIVKVQHDSAGYNLNLVSSYLDDNGEVIPPGGLDMGDGATLERFLCWTLPRFPAKHYLLDLWDHGSGIFGAPLPRVPFREVCGGLNLWEIRDAVKTALAQQTLVDKFDIIGFDACVMGWIETTYSLRDVTDIVLASENSEPGPGWDYGPPLINLRENIDTYTAEEFARDIAQYYIISYTDPNHPYHYLCDNVTQSASRVSTMLDTAVPALDNFATVSMNYLPEYKAEFEKCLDATSYWGYEVTDLGHLMYEINQDVDMPTEVRDAAQVVRNAVEQSMVYHGHNNGVPDQESGWTIWFPRDITLQPQVYQDEYLMPGYIEFYETKWDEFLYAYADQIPVNPGWFKIVGSTWSDLAGGDGDMKIEPDETIDVTLTIKNVWTESATNLIGDFKCQTGYESIYEVVDSQAGFPDLDPDQTGMNTVPFRIHILPGCPQGTVGMARIDITCDQSQSTNLPLSFVIDPSDVLVIDQDPDHVSSPAIESAIEANGFTVDMMTCDFEDAPLGAYEAVFISLGMYDWTYPNYVPDQGDYDAVQAYLDAGGKVYLESGDLWAFYPLVGAPDFGPSFGIVGISDGWEDIIDLYGEPGSIMDGLLMIYPGNDSYADHIGALAGADLILNATNYYDPDYGVMVSYDTGTYKTVGASIEFGGIEDGLKDEVMSRILDFLGL